MRLRPQHEVVSVKNFWPLVLDALDLGRPEARLHRADRAEGDLVLQRENVVQRAAASLGSDMRAGLGLDQLRGDADAVARLAESATSIIQRALHRDLGR